MCALLALVTAAGAPGASGLARSHRPKISAIANVSRLSGNQSETAVAIDQLDPSRLTITSNVATADELFHAWSTDSGATWSEDFIATGARGDLPAACCDSSLTSDEFGNIFLVYLSTTDRAVVALSTDGGKTFSRLTTVTAPASATVGTGSHPGRSLIAGRSLGAQDQPTITAGKGEVWITDTVDVGGKVMAVGAPVTGLGQVGAFQTPEVAHGHATGDYGDIAIGPDGQVMIAYQDPTGGEHGATIYTDLDPDGLGPHGFQPSQTVGRTNVGGFDYIPAQQRRSVDAEVGLAWDRDPSSAHFGRLYLLWTSENPDESDNMDIRLEHSDDGGATWGGAIRVNHDRTRTSQFLPRLALDETTGNLAVTWYDCRNDLGTGGPGDTDGVPNDDAMYYAGISPDGGSTISNIQLTPSASNAHDASNGIDFGDYEGLAFFAGDAHPAWADNSNSTGDNPDGTLHQLDVYSVRIHLG